ncbi:MAG: RNA-directed DNA polymerase [Phycisphaerae bacterium]|nr:RNA-directed DNA polymerase [Phycisphaerae bacterium]
MGILNWLLGRRLRARRPAEYGPPRFGLADLVRRLGLSEAELRAVRASYREFEVPKRSGGTRRLAAPEPALKALQKRILRRALGRLKAHPAATGFERGHSIVTHALFHAGKAVVVRIDIQEFFASTAACRVEDYLRRIGWDAEATAALVKLCTHNGGLPQGAPTSPRLSNLVNRGLDARMQRLAAGLSACYSRYADDLTFSFDRDQSSADVRRLIGGAKAIITACGYRMHLKRKLHVRRCHQRQQVTGLVVNGQPSLPRETRRRLRAIEHHLRTGRPASLTPEQLAGWDSLRSMIETQRAQSPGGTG